MTNPLIMQLKVRLSKEKKELKELELKMLRAMNELSGYVNPFFGEDYESIRADEIEQIGDEIRNLKEKMIAERIQIKLIDKELGG